ncbi:MAG: hypothetical protein ACK4J0_01865 [Candidatus Anstonellaceae archaeon]
MLDLKEQNLCLIDKVSPLKQKKMFFKKIHLIPNKAITDDRENKFFSNLFFFLKSQKSEVVSNFKYFDEAISKKVKLTFKKSEANNNFLVPASTLAVVKLYKEITKLEYIQKSKNEEDLFLILDFIKKQKIDGEDFLLLSELQTKKISKNKIILFDFSHNNEDEVIDLFWLYSKSNNGENHPFHLLKELKIEIPNSFYKLLHLIRNLDANFQRVIKVNFIFEQVEDKEAKKDKQINGYEMNGKDEDKEKRKIKNFAYFLELKKILEEWRG